MKKPSSKKPVISRGESQTLAQAFGGEGTFDAAFYSLAVFGDKEPLVEYLMSGKPLNSEMKMKLARLFSGDHHAHIKLTSGAEYGPFDLVVQQRKKPPCRPSSDPEEMEKSNREAAEKIWLLVMCKRWKKETAIQHVRKETGLGANPLRAALKRVEEDFEHELPILRGPTARKTLRAK